MKVERDIRPNLDLNDIAEFLMERNELEMQIRTSDLELPNAVPVLDISRVMVCPSIECDIYGYDG